MKKSKMKKLLIIAIIFFESISIAANPVILKLRWSVSPLENYIEYRIEVIGEDGTDFIISTAIPSFDLDLTTEVKYQILIVGIKEDFNENQISEMTWEAGDRPFLFVTPK